VSTDLEVRRRNIELAKDDPSAVLAPDEIEPVVGPTVLASWRRCEEQTRLRELDAAPVDAADTTRARWDESPIQRAAPGLVDELDHIARTSDLIACVADADGRVMWQSTPRWLRQPSERIGLLPGGVWHESTTGTNGIGLSLAADQPTAVFATEHLMDPVQDWVCYAAPIHAPGGVQLGTLNLSTTWRHANPLALTTVASLARVVEHEVRLQHSASGVRSPALELQVLGEPQAALDGMSLRLTQRQFEILTILCVAGTATLGDLHARLYGDRPVAVATLKAEMSRLRRVLGGQLTSRPYRVSVPYRVDAVQLLDRLDRGDVEGAALLYRGQLLPASEAPFVQDHRHHLDVALRTALLLRGDAAAVLRYNAVHPYDVEVLEQIQGRASADDPLVPALTARLAVATGL
jgi:hypothetical protein